MEKKINEKIRDLKIQLGAAIFVFFVLIISGLVFFGPSIQKVALALNPTDYNKVAGDQLQLTDWNRLDSDFVARDGGDVISDLDMNSNRITNLANPVNNSDATNLDSVNAAITSALTSFSAGGHVFTNWGMDTCPLGTTFIYTGFAFGSPYNIEGGSGDLVCMRYPLVGSEASPVPVNTGHSYSVGTGHSNYIPSDISDYTEIKCSLCYQPSSCYINWGSDTCATSFLPVYDGWIMSRMNNAARQNQTNYVCLNREMGLDSAPVVNNNNFSPLVGSTIRDDSDVGLYTTDSYIKCSYCCN